MKFKVYAHDHLGGENWMPYQWNSATFVQNDYGKFQQNAYVPAKPPFIQYAISYIVYYRL